MLTSVLWGRMRALPLSGVLTRNAGTSVSVYRELTKPPGRKATAMTLIIVRMSTSV